MADAQESAKKPRADDAIAADTTFSFEDLLIQGLINEVKFANVDLGPTDALNGEELARQMQSYFGFGASPLTSPDVSRPSSRSSTHSSRSHHLSSASSSFDSPPSTPQPSPSNAVANSKVFSGNSQARKRKRKAREHRRIVRQKNSKEKRDSPAQYTVRPATVLKHILRAKSTTTQYDISTAPIASMGFVALPDSGGRVCTLKHLIDDLGFRYIEASGSESRAITDIRGRVVAIYAGAPNAEDWTNVCNSAFEALQESASRCDFPKKVKKHRRGLFPALNVGISFGGGQKAPGNLYHTSTNTKELSDLVQHPSFVRIAGFASGVFAAWAPNLYEYYEQHFEALLDNNPKLCRNFHNSVWAAAAYNFGPNTVTTKHRDFANLPFGLCGITALGRFDHTKGGHVVLWEFKLVIELPPGATILIPSAIVSHSNTPIRKGEARCSFTQFSPGGLFRWVDHGFQKDEYYFEGMTDSEKIEVVRANKERCKLGISLFSTLDELCAP